MKMPAKFTSLLPYTSLSVTETLDIGRLLAPLLLPGSVLALYGEMGAGKTHLVKGLCMGWGIPHDMVNSPTFTVVNEYQGNNFPVYHFDAYRIEHPTAFLELGFEEYFYGKGVCIIEWPERVVKWLPADAVCLQLTHLDEGKRLISLRS
ncbi:MAG: tRNA (adenosine(37)-N6)-threonylcarbamoyltransferase complex ATPase subunit type 1 TsaE [Bacteroidetes Order II. Incertae sedis bacterium]|nr:tRNA (adenosine(37)-N6)-threonylcarbamoyltransferase complex ATPase subunit type 1 TsaE [Bacteroidetes Order II. bacterium]